MRTRFDQLAKSILVTALESLGDVESEREIAGQLQSVDVCFRLDPARTDGLASLGLLGRIAEASSSMLEPFSRTPGIAQVRTCLRRQYMLHQDDALAARPGEAGEAEQAPFPALWIISSGRPETVIGAYGLTPIPGWPTGCWQRLPVDDMNLVSVRDLPRTRDTLLVRLLGRGSTFRQAVQELIELPDEALEKHLAMPALVALRLDIPHNSEEKEMQEALRDLREVYAEWEERVRREALSEGLHQGLDRGLREGRREGRRAGERAIVCRLLEKRFGPLPDEIAARVARAELEDVERWADRVLVAQTLDEVFSD